MSAGYASRLSAYPNKGVVGLPESFDSKRQRDLKLKKLSELVLASQHLVVVTGAGISTSAGIPDFRGPEGIWTVEKKARKTKLQNRKRKHSDSMQDKKLESSDKKYTQNSRRTDTMLDSDCASMDFSKAQPTLTHKALTRLAIDGKIKYLITQNVDGLHRRAGLMRNIHCSLHGCAFTERCKNPDCLAEFFRDFDIGGMSFQPTGRSCSLCSQQLLDTLLDWEDALPEADFERAEAECDKADLVICLGTSLRIEPVGSLPLRARKFIIVNLQVTPKDEHAALIIKAPVDLVMEHLMSSLGFDDSWKDTVAPVERVWTPQGAKKRQKT
mmetsp:Transcript_3399/g.7779  ORF Transcript_3399/g.7779 Transcript_3399/m.7779 type:complete len:327 (-) Transcript_3399:430-1410(-)|eukprot:CAMPEP_0113605036 /NCGR_PEP_ID=MMETSP0017_2-20120614/2111_1 /TAXON_ID=2856 /ORGANISM="Cylindrotheca closterium" /LENGTH=326 /DNA_ID=CAMNT_0000513495 /DNA_START=173 /DNA_END=1153 /DNA_ORIENTATION=+ /assembly_acc=CAM_ASM_000147